ncbi:hypothetical protein C5167_021734 [Papaver somniferum]|uniref:Uncharacterized protein n=1 Tax=Papaver somniferum TaxID=3469 RepID=A0A4Y7JJY9_PAPSO|nr:hypothetical protein C5167_021734 [Papaver somniferum]
MMTERVHPRRCKTRFCGYGFKVHLYILKDKVKQKWIEEETFDVKMKENSVLQDPFCRFFGYSTNANTGNNHPTRIFSFSDQLMLYWFDGGYLIFYNLQMKHYNVVEGTRSCNEENRAIFEAKMSGIAPDPGICEDDDTHCPCSDYQLHAQMENIISLTKFIPEGVKVAEFDCIDSIEDWMLFIPEGVRGWVTRPYSHEIEIQGKKVGII